MRDLSLRLFRQCAWALSVFCLFAFAMEWLIPDSITPYLHVLPLAILAILLLAVDACFTSPKKSLSEWIVCAILFLSLSVAVFFSFSGSGMTNVIAIGIFILMMIATGAFLLFGERGVIDTD